MPDYLRLVKTHSKLISSFAKWIVSEVLIDEAVFHIRLGRA